MRRAPLSAAFFGADSGPFPARQAAAVRSRQQAKKQERGLNENYGREVMELHTIGVDAGYTQQDVIEMAKCLTGWTIREPRRDPEFLLRRSHFTRRAKKSCWATRSITAARKTAKKP